MSAPCPSAARIENPSLCAGTIASTAQKKMYSDISGSTFLAINLGRPSGPGFQCCGNQFHNLPEKMQMAPCLSLIACNETICLPSICDPYDFLYYHPGRQTGGACIPARSTFATDFFRVFSAVFASIKASNRISASIDLSTNVCDGAHVPL